MDKKEIYDVIIKTCADVCNVSVDDITGESRKENVVSARALYPYCKKLLCDCHRTHKRK